MEFNLIPFMQMLIYVFIVLKALEFAFPSLFRSLETKTKKNMMTYGKEYEFEKMKKDGRMIEEDIAEDVLLSGSNRVK